MPVHQDIQACIQQCQQVEAQLRNMAAADVNPQAKKMLSEGAHHLRLCIEECQWSLQQLQAATAAAALA
ncbi:hypothetical protein [Caldinitratiruptor microaerophilus]|uniref:Uncharacterized protein n=1 Tax=Caldinitratiruptor microaerophilus TaxID=671077 RepID=A0AA35CPA2_9FIRM|nr:hypothetical protein [Caldinitratiruptor microaerophilus]BDG61166.1 hypothetical protein caldi_22560 [Caldinitratiruptor microaerophilus]